MNDKHYRDWYLCQCQCGTIRPVSGNSLRMNQSKSCGCMRKETLQKNPSRLRHGEARMNNRSKEWRSWNAMIRRCTYPSMERFPIYGGRGITICNQWRNSFETFLKDMGRAPSNKHSLDRIDNNGNYEPDNCRWATNSEQIKNSRKARLITYNGKTQNLCDWVKETGIKRTTIQMRIDVQGWSIEKALTTPVRKKI